MPSTPRSAYHASCRGIPRPARIRSLGCRFALQPRLGLHERPRRAGPAACPDRRRDRRPGRATAGSRTARAAAATRSDHQDAHGHDREGGRRRARRGISSATEPAAAQMPPPATIANNGTTGISDAERQRGVADFGCDRDDQALGEHCQHHQTEQRQAPARSPRIAQVQRRRCPQPPASPQPRRRIHGSEAAARQGRAQGMTIAGSHTSVASEPAEHPRTQAAAAAWRARPRSERPATPRPIRYAHRKPVPSSVGPMSDTRLCE